MSDKLGMVLSLLNSMPPNLQKKGGACVAPPLILIKFRPEKWMMQYVG